MKKRIKIIHTADVHIGSFFPDGDFVDKKLRERGRDLLNTFSAIVSSVLEHDADMLVISGDLFEEGSVRQSDINRVLKTFADIAPLPVIIAPGNHDYYRPGGYYDWLDWPENVHIFKSAKFDKIDFPEKGISVYGTAFTSAEDRKNPLPEFSREKGLPLSMLVYHGSLAVPQGEESPYRPFLVDELMDIPVDYIALGHFHKRKILKDESGRIKASYPGSPEVLNFGEAHPHSYNLVTITESSVKVEYIESGSRRFVVLGIDCTDLGSDEDIIKKAKDAAEAENATDKDIIKIELKGEPAAGLTFDIDYISDELRQSFFWCTVKDRTSPAFDLESISGEESARGKFVNRLNELIEDARKAGEREKEEILSDAVYYGLLALEGRKPDKR